MNWTLIRCAATVMVLYPVCSFSSSPAASMQSLVNIEPSISSMSPLISSRAPCSLNSQSKYDLWVVGCGHLGSLVAQEWRRRYPMSSVVTETLTPARHALLQRSGAITRLRKDRRQSDFCSAANVLICFPPSSAGDNLAEEVNEACKLWLGSGSKATRSMDCSGALLYTSSTVVYGADSEGHFNENSAIDRSSPRAKRQALAEDVTQSHEGSVMRLAGLYSAQRGPHKYWLDSPRSDAPSLDDQLVNLIHYRDAAMAIVAALEKGERNQIYLACDEKPLLKSEILLAAVRSGRFPDVRLGSVQEGATAPTSRRGKRLDCSLTRQLLKWRPSFESFEEYIQSSEDR